MLTHPTAAELVGGVAAWLPIDGKASTFLLRVARNALEIAARDLVLGPTADARAIERLRTLGFDGATREAAERALVDAIRAGTVPPDDPALVAHFAACALDALAIDQPRYAHRIAP